MKNFLQPGDVITVTAPAAVLSGDVVKVGQILGVAAYGGVEGASVDIKLGGVFELAKVAAEAWTVGERIYFDAGAKLVTTVAAGNSFIGVAVEAAANPSASGIVRLNATAADAAGAMGEAAAVDDLDGTLAATPDGTLADAAIVDDIALATGDSYSDATVNAAVNAAVADVNAALAVINKNTAETLAKVNQLLAAKRAAGQMAASA